MNARLKDGLKFWAPLALLFYLFVKFLRTEKTPQVSNVKIHEDYRAYILAQLSAAGITGELAKYIFSQAAFETGNFSSVIFKEQNNLFGMKLARVRPTTATGEKRGHAVFKSIADSVKDYAIYYRYVKLPSAFSGIPAFTRALKDKKYFEADYNQYTAGVETYYKAYFA